MHSSIWILIISHDLILDNVVDINLKCSEYKFCHLENSLAGFQYVFFFVFLINVLYPMWIFFSLEMVFSLCNYTIVIVFYFIILQHFCCHCISLLSQESCFSTLENSVPTKDIYLFIKDANEYQIERLNKMSLLIMHLNDLYNINNINYLKQLNICTMSYK